MIKRRNNDAKARADAVFRKSAETTPTNSGHEETSMSADDKPGSASQPVETTEGAMDEYLARQDAERAKMAKLRALWLAAEAKAASKPKAKQKPANKAKETRGLACRADSSRRRSAPDAGRRSLRQEASRCCMPCSRMLPKVIGDAFCR